MGRQRVQKEPLRRRREFVGTSSFQLLALVSGRGFHSVSSIRLHRHHVLYWWDWRFKPDSTEAAASTPTPPQIVEGRSPGDLRQLLPDKLRYPQAYALQLLSSDVSDSTDFPSNKSPADARPRTSAVEQLPLATTGVHIGSREVVHAPVARL